MTARKVRWAVVGTGGIARRTVGDLRLCDTAEVVAVASRSRSTALEFAQGNGLALAFDDFDALCASRDLDAVYIGTPHATHFDLARRALRAGKHVLCEKPLTMTADEARELGRVAAASGAFLMEAMWMKFSLAMQRAAELVGSGLIGEPRFLQAGLGFPVPPDGPRRYWDAALGGGALYDLGVYTITLAQAYFGEPAEIRATGSMRPDGVDLEEAITLRFASGAMAQLATSITFLIPPRGWLGGTKGSIDFGEPLFSPGSLRITTGKPPAPPTVRDEAFAKEGNGYVPMFRAVNERILAGAIEHPLHPVSATVQVLETLQAIQRKLAEERDARANAAR
jgi:predicted dehydrogenase